MTGMASGYLLGQVLEEKQGEMTSLGSLVYWLAVTSNMHNKNLRLLFRLTYGWR